MNRRNNSQAHGMSITCYHFGFFDFAQGRLREKSRIPHLVARMHRDKARDGLRNDGIDEFMPFKVYIII